MSTMDTVAMLLVVVGAINLGLSALGVDVLSSLGSLTRILNILIGVAGVLVLWKWYAKK